MNDVIVPVETCVVPAAWPEDKSFVFEQADLVINTLTISSKVKPEAYAWLEQAAREVNDVWNFCNQTSHKAWNNYVGQRTWMSAFDMNDLLAGVGEVYNKIGIDIAQSVAGEHAIKRNTTHYSKLGWRKSGGSKKSLGWIPFKANTMRFSLYDTNGKRVKLKNDPQPIVPAWPKKNEGESKDDYTARKEKFAPIRYEAEKQLQAWEYRKIQAADTIKLSFMDKTIRLFNAHRLLEAYRLSKQGVGCLRSGNFAQDSLADWYLNIVVDRVELQLAPLSGLDSSVGLDPGQVTAMTGSDGSHYIPNIQGANVVSNVLPELRSRRYREMESKIQQAQKNGHKKHAKRLHRKVKRQRKNDRDLFCKAITMTYSRIWIGDIKPQKLAKSKLKGQAKSIMDSGIGLASATLKSLGHRAGRVVQTVDERYSTRRCCCCTQLTGPYGLSACDVRQWTCSACGTFHLRDTCGGENIRLTGEISWNQVSFEDRVKSVAPKYWRPTGTR